MIGQILSKLLKEKNMNVSQLAQQSKVNINTLYSIIKRNNMKVDFNVLLKICEALNVDVEIFYKDFLQKNKTQQNKTSYTSDEKELVDTYRILNNSGKEKAQEYITDLSEQEKYTK